MLEYFYFFNRSPTVEVSSLEIPGLRQRQYLEDTSCRACIGQRKQIINIPSNGINKGDWKYNCLIELYDKPSYSPFEYQFCRDDRSHHMGLAIALSLKCCQIFILIRTILFMSRGLTASNYITIWTINLRLLLELLWTSGFLTTYSL